MTQLYQLYTLYTSVHFIKILLFLIYVPVIFATVVPDDDGQRSADEDHRPSRSQTPPTPPVQAEPSQSPPSSPRPMRCRVEDGEATAEAGRTATAERWLLIAFGTPESNPKLLATMKGLAWELN